MSGPDALEAAHKARTDTVLDRGRYDSRTGQSYTIRQRLDAGAYAYRTVHYERGKRDTYGLVLATEIGPDGVEYMTPVVPSTKLVHDYAASLPIIEFDEDTGTIYHVITDAEWAHLTGVDA